jgi:CSLREA domain-containing protein
MPAAAFRRATLKNQIELQEISMQRQLCRGLALVLLLSAGQGIAATISVDITADEDNGNTMGPNPVGTGCSLREALQAVANNDGNPYNGCAAATVGGPNTIDIAVGGTITVNEAMPDPSQPPGSTIRNGSLPNAMDAGTHGALTVTNGGGATVSCDAAPNGKIIFNEAMGADFTLSGLTIANCTADGGGIAISNVNGGNLKLNNVSFTNIKSDTGGPGGAIAHSNGSLAMNNVSFTGCSTDDGAGLGDGGAIWIGQVTLPQTVSLANTTFTNNTAAENGGAIYWTAADSLGHTVQMTNLTFTGNIANGDSSVTPEYGGGAIWSKNSSSGGPPLWLIASSAFLNNQAPKGVGGAIAISSNGTLAYPAATTPLLGGIVASHFSGNSAGGAASADLRGGSGGAIYMHGDALTAVESSFVNNMSQHGSGGAIANFSPNPSSPAVFANVTFSGDSADQNGGAIANLRDGGQITLLNDTISGNSANGAGGTPGGGAIFNVDTNAGNVQASNTIFASSAGAGGNCANSPSGLPVQDVIGNLQFSPNTGCGNMVAGDPRLSAPANLGGPNTLVLEMDLNAAGSPASGTGCRDVRERASAQRRRDRPHKCPTRRQGELRYRRLRIGRAHAGGVAVVRRRLNERGGRARRDPRRAPGGAKQ